MARKPNYENLSIVGDRKPAEDATMANAPALGGAGEGDREPHLIADRSHHTMIYHSPEAHKAIARYALELSGHKAKVKVHDLWVQAMQEFCDRNGLGVTVRIEPKGKA